MEWTVEGPPSLTVVWSVLRWSMERSPSPLHRQADTLAGVGKVPSKVPCTPPRTRRVVAGAASISSTSSSTEIRSETSEILDTATASETEEGTGSKSRSLSPCKVPASDKAEGDNWCG